MQGISPHSSSLHPSHKHPSGKLIGNCTYQHSRHHDDRVPHVLTPILVMVRRSFRRRLTFRTKRGCGARPALLDTERLDSHQLRSVPPLELRRAEEADRGVTTKPVV